MIRTNWTKSLVILSGLILLLACLGPTQPPASHLAVPVQPVLVQLATSQPDRMVSIIVQKNRTAARVEDQVAELGGRVTAELHLINGFAAQMSAGRALKLAANSGVRWVSLDAPMYSASSDASLSWATTIGRVVQNQFTDAANMVDGSGLGPNGSFGYRMGNAKGSFSGFQ